jgi:hypothetical protein
MKESPEACLLPTLCRREKGLRQAAPSALSVIASGWVPDFTTTDAIPSTLRSLSSGTFIGPGEGAVPGAG